MKSLYFVLVLLVSTISVLHVGPVFASPTLTLAITANNGTRVVDVRIMTLVLQPWGTDVGAGLYGWRIVDQESGVSIPARHTITLLYDLPYGPYVINLDSIADLGGLMVSITNCKMVTLNSDATVNMVVN
jgi:hypothetical protein